MSILIGIDGGGTGCRAVVCDRGGNLLGFGKSGSANIATNFDGACDNIIKATKEAMLDAQLANSKMSEAYVYLGLAGANLEDYNKRLKQALPFRDCYVDSDASLALVGAVGDGDGVAAIIGTGSVFISRYKNKIKMIGGWGFLISDQASGARLARALLEETILCYDKIHKCSGLTNYILEKFENSPQEIVKFASNATPGEFGEFAPIIFEFKEKNDPVANSLIKKAVSDIEKAINILLENEDQQLYLLGGLGKKYIKYLDAKIQKRIREPKGDALKGAAILAVKRFS